MSCKTHLALVAGQIVPPLDHEILAIVAHALKGLNSREQVVAEPDADRLSGLGVEMPVAIPIFTGNRVEFDQLAEGVTADAIER